MKRFLLLSFALIFSSSLFAQFGGSEWYSVHLIPNLETQSNWDVPGGMYGATLEYQRYYDTRTWGVKSGFLHSLGDTTVEAWQIPVAVTARQYFHGEHDRWGGLYISEQAGMSYNFVRQVGDTQNPNVREIRPEVAVGLGLNFWILCDYNIFVGTNFQSSNSMTIGTTLTLSIFEIGDRMELW